MSKEFVRFLLVGATNTLFSYLLFLSLLTFMSYLPAYSIAYCAGIVCSYLLNIQFVFKNRVSLVSFLKYPAVYVIQYALGAIMFLLLVDKADFSPAIVMLVIIFVSIPITFFVSRFVLKN